MLNVPQPIRTDVFFREHYRDILTLAARLPGALVPLRQASTLEADIEPLLADLIDLCRRTNAVLGVVSDRAYPRSISGALDAVSDTAASGAAVEGDPKLSNGLSRLTEHVRYFSERFQPGTDDAHGRFADATKKTLFFEVVFNCANIILAGLTTSFRFAPEDPRQSTLFFDHAAVRDACEDPSRRVIDACQQQLEGWCGESKTWLLYDLVRRARPTQAVEIGIFGGRSIIPIALALRDNGDGVVTGIEAWAPEAATEEPTHFGNAFWWACLDFAAIKRSFLEFVVSHRLTSQIRVIEAPSRLAHHCIETIDFLHIDGNHALMACAQDVANYVVKLKAGGILVFDDINLVTTHPALEIVMRSCTLLHTTAVPNDPTTPGCAAFRKL